MFKNLIFILILAVGHVSAARDPNECEVCISALTSITKTFKSPAPKMTLVEIEEAVGAYCEKPPSEKFEKLVSTQNSLLGVNLFGHVGKFVDNLLCYSFFAGWYIFIKVVQSVNEVFTN